MRFANSSAEIEEREKTKNLEIPDFGCIFAIRKVRKREGLTLFNPIVKRIKTDLPIEENSAL